MLRWHLQLTSEGTIVGDEHSPEPNPNKTEPPFIVWRSSHFSRMYSNVIESIRSGKICKVCVRISFVVQVRRVGSSQISRPSWERSSKKVSIARPPSSSPSHIFGKPFTISFTPWRLLHNKVNNTHSPPCTVRTVWEKEFKWWPKYETHWKSWHPTYTVEKIKEHIQYWKKQHDIHMHIRDDAYEYANTDHTLLDFHCWPLQ